MESLIAVGILSVSVLAVTFAISAGLMIADEADLALEAVDAGEELLERVLALPYNDPDGPSALGPEAGESAPADFDNADDYAGYTDNWTSATGYSLSRAVSITSGSQTLNAVGAPIDGITVTVNILDGAVIVWSVSRFIPAEAS